MFISVPQHSLVSLRLPETRKCRQPSFLFLDDASKSQSGDDVVVVAVVVDDYNRQKETKISAFVFSHHNLSYCSGCDPHIWTRGIGWDPFVVEDAAASMLGA